jgi:cyclase
MLKKRLIGVVTVKNGWAVQSFGYQRYLPLGKPECLVENLDRWGADEILIQDIDRSKNQEGPNLDLISRITARGIATPLMYAGGIATVADAVATVRAGIERVCLDSLLHSAPDTIKGIAHSLGGQAVVVSMPAIINEQGAASWFDYQGKQTKPINDDLLSLIEDDCISELLMIDKCHEGGTEGFNFDLLSLVADIGIPLILFGGFYQIESIARALSNPKVTAVAIGNYLNYREHEIQRIRQGLAATAIRQPVYQTTYLLNDLSIKQGSLENND